jgi:hypothetical protein
MVVGGPSAVHFVSGDGVQAGEATAFDSITKNAICGSFDSQGCTPIIHTSLATSARMSVESAAGSLLSGSTIRRLAARVGCFALSELVYEQIRELSIHFLRAALKVGGAPSASFWVYHTLSSPELNNALYHIHSVMHYVMIYVPIRTPSSGAGGLAGLPSVHQTLATWDFAMLPLPTREVQPSKVLAVH